jgi:DNA-binding response OmpR family regulator
MLKGKTVLIAEDDSTMQMFVVGTLKQELNCDNIVTFKNGKQVLKSLKTRFQSVPLHLILCDWEMPGATGDEILKYMKGDAKLRRVPFIMTTSRSDEESLKKVIKMGVNDYLIKPFSVNDLVERIGRIMQKEDTKKLVTDDTIDTPSVELLLNSASAPYKGTLREVSLNNCVTRFPVFKQGLKGLSGNAKLTIKLKGYKINLKVLVENVAPDTAGVEEEEFLIVSLKVTEIDDANREMLKRMLSNDTKN